MQSVIFKSVLKLNSQLGLHTTVTLTCVLVQRHWSPLTASMKTAQETHHCLHHKETPQGGKESHLVCTPSILSFFSNNWFVKHSPDQVSLLESSSQIVTHPFSVWSRGGVHGHCAVQVRGAGAGCGPRVFSVNGTPGLCMWDALAFWHALFIFGCAVS